MPAPKTILFPTDLSEPSEAAIPFVQEWARRFDAVVHLLHVLDLGMLLTDFSWADYTPRELEEERKARVESELKVLAKRLQLGDGQCTLEAVHGVAYEEIVRYAEDRGIDLIIMATHGRTGLSHLLLGSTTERVVRMAGCPVLTVRADSTALKERSTPNG